MPNKNRPLVRDGRIQVKKKRTDRSYLRPGPAPAETAVLEDQPSGIVEAPEQADAPETPAAAPIAQPEPAAPERPRSSAATATSVRPATGQLPTAVRALQQQGVRKRREFDVHALAIRDTKYALHELRRIAILASMVVITLIVLGFVLH